MADHALDRLAGKLTDLAGVDVALERPSDPAHGDYATNVALRSAKSVKRPPRELAAELAERFAELEAVASTDVAGPGFLNLRLTDAFFVEMLGEVDGTYGSGSDGQRVQVEMVSANPTGPITVASARNGAYGDAVARLLAFAGDSVQREYY